MNSSMICLATTLAQALAGLKEDPHGFSFVDTSVFDFPSIDVQTERVYHQFGQFEMTQNEIANFLSQVGQNNLQTALQAAAQIEQLICEVVQTSQKETAWIYLRSFTPTGKFDLPHWHIDGRYYTPESPDDLLFKFVVTLKGPSTLFYLLPEEQRKTAERHTQNRHYMKDFCQADKITAPSPGQGAVFNPARGAGFSALHSEPPIHEERILLAIVPCMQSQLTDLKARVSVVYPRDSREMER